jgi:hypothetical protein
MVASLVGCSIPIPSHTTATATVVKVYSATDVAGHAFIAYVVDHNGVEVVVSDPLARTSHSVGDTIQFMEMKMQLSGGQVKTIAYSIFK